MLPEWPCIISTVFFSWLSGSFLLPEEKEHGLDMSEDYVLYGVFGAAERSVSGVDMSKNHVLYRVFGVAERSVWAGHVGESTSTGQSASSSHRMLPGSPTRFLPIASFSSSLPRHLAVRRKPLNLASEARKSSCWAKDRICWLSASVSSCSNRSTGWPASRQLEKPKHVAL